MFHICFAADENYIKYAAVLITSIVKSTDTLHKFKDFFETDAKLGTNADTINTKRERERESKADNSLKSYKKLDYSALSDDEKSEGYAFHILTDKISENSRQKLENLAQKLIEIYPCEIKIHLCDDSLFQGLPRLNGKYLTYFRLFMPNFMPKDAKICLYLDTDMLVMQDLRELFTLDLSGKVVGVVKDWLYMLHKKICAKSPKDKDFIFTSNLYFNAGFLLVNLSEWQRCEIYKQVFDFLSKYSPSHHDQDALNFAISEPLALTLPCKFNLFINAYHRKSGFELDYNLDEIIFSLINPTILHIYGEEKPWIKPNGIGELRKIQWWLVALQTPFFSDELREILTSILQGEISLKALQNRQQTLEQELRLWLGKKRDFYTLTNYVGGSLIVRCLRGFGGYFKIPFVAYSALKNAEKMRLDELEKNAPKLSRSEEILAAMLYEAAEKAYRKKFKLKLLYLPYRVWRLKKKAGAWMWSSKF